MKIRQVFFFCCWWMIGSGCFIPHFNKVNGQDLSTGGKLLKLYVGISDDKGAALSQPFQPQDLEVLEDRLSRPIRSVTREDGPVSIGILLDVSSPQRKQFPAMLSAATQFVQASAPASEFFLLSVGQKNTLISDFAGAAATLEKLKSPETEAGCKVYDGIRFGLEKVQHGKYDRRALLVITAGQEFGSQIRHRQLMEAIKGSDVQIYALGIGNTGSYESAEGADFRVGRLLLEEMAALTGGLVYLNTQTEQLTPNAQRLAHQLWHQYGVTYESAQPGAAQTWRKLKVRLYLTPTVGSKLRIRYQSQYQESK